MARPAPPARAHPARGVALIATAVILGFFVLRNAWDQGVPVVTATDENAEEAPQDESPDDADGDDANDGDGEDDAGPVRPAEEITVLVANTTGVAGAAGNYTALLAEGGYQTVDPTNAEGPLETSVVFFMEGFEREAAELAQALADPPTDIEPLPEEPPVDPGGAQLVVMIGNDLA